MKNLLLSFFFLTLLLSSFASSTAELSRCVSLSVLGMHRPLDTLIPLFYKRFLVEEVLLNFLHASFEDCVVLFGVDVYGPRVESGVDGDVKVVGIWTIGR